METETKEELTYERLKGLVTGGFRISQGDNNLLRLVWAWLHNHYPEYKVSDEVRDKLAEELKPVYKALLIPKGGQKAHHATHYQDIDEVRGAPVKKKFDTEFVEKTVDQNMQRLQILLNNLQPWDIETLVKDHVLEIPTDLQPSYVNDVQTLNRGITMATIMNEHHILVGMGGRPVEAGDKHVSFICQYALSKSPKKTGYKEYDELWKEVREYVMDKVEGHEWSPGKFFDFYELIMTYNQTHPNDQINLENLGS